MASIDFKAFRVVGFCFGAQRDEVFDIDFRGTSSGRDVTSRGRRRFCKSAAMADGQTCGAARPLRLRPRAVFLLTHRPQWSERQGARRASRECARYRRHALNERDASPTPSVTAAARQRSLHRFSAHVSLADSQYLETVRPPILRWNIEDGRRPIGSIQAPPRRKISSAISSTWAHLGRGRIRG